MTGGHQPTHLGLDGQRPVAMDEPAHTAESPRTRLRSHHRFPRPSSGAASRLPVQRQPGRCDDAYTLGRDRRRRRRPAGTGPLLGVRLGWPVTYEDPDEWVVGPPSDDPAQQGQPPLVFGPPIMTPRPRRWRCISPGLQLRRASVRGGGPDRSARWAARRHRPRGRHLVCDVADPEDNELVSSATRARSARIRPPFAGISPVAAVVRLRRPRTDRLLVGGHRMADPRPRRRRCVAP